MKETDKLKELIGEKVTDIDIKWDNLIDDYYIESITFDNGAVLELWARTPCVEFTIKIEAK